MCIRDSVRSTDGDGGRVSLHGDFDLRGGEGAVDLDARLDGVLARVGAGEGEGAAVLFQFVVDRPLDVGICLLYTSKASSAVGVGSVSSSMSQRASYPARAASRTP